MPLYNKYRPRKTNRRRKTKKPLAKMVKRIINRDTETKCLPITAGYADLEVGSFRTIQLSAVSVGSQMNQREGEIISPIAIKGKIAVKVIAETNPVVVRVQLIKFKQCDGTAPTLADILPKSSATLDYLAVEQPFLDTNGYGLTQARRKYKILYDKTVMLANPATNYPWGFKVWSLNKKLSGRTVFSSSNATDEGNNQYYLFIHTNAAIDKLQETHDIRFFYKDM